MNLSLSQLRPHHLPYATIKVHLRTLTQRQLQSGKHSCWETFLLGYIPTRVHSYQPQWLLQEATPQRRAARHTIILAHFAADFVKLKAKGLKGIMEKTNFFLITIFKTSEVTYIGRVEIKSNNAFSVDSLPLFVKARTSKEECELPHIAHEGEPLCRAVTQHRQGLFPPQ